MDQAQTNAIGIPRSPAQQVELLTRMSLAAGIRGFVTSPEEVAALRALTGSQGILVTPGIRPAGSAKGDQSRIATPAEALRQGASFLVVGRPSPTTQTPPKPPRPSSTKWPKPSNQPPVSPTTER